MTQPSDAAVNAWIALQRAQAAALGQVEAALKGAELPSLAWYDVLLELERAGPLRPRALQARLLFAQYNLSRLLDRLEKAEVIERTPCPEDQRGQLVAISAAGRRLRRRMWSVYGPAIASAIGAKLDDDDAMVLAGLLYELGRTATAA